MAYDKETQKKYDEEYYAKNKEHLRELSRLRYSRNKETRKEEHQKWINNNKEHMKEYHKEYAIRNKERDREKKKAQSKRYYEKHKEAKNKYGREYAVKNKERDREKRNALSRKWWNNNKSKTHESKLKQNYGITINEYTQMLIKQSNCCAICGSSQGEFKRNFAVDHNHKNGEIRELLCANCNTMLGNAKDNPKILQKAIDYLNKWSHE
jgi:hypothetical protein